MLSNANFPVCRTQYDKSGGAPFHVLATMIPSIRQLIRTGVPETTAGVTPASNPGARPPWPADRPGRQLASVMIPITANGTRTSTPPAHSGSGSAARNPTGMMTAAAAARLVEPAVQPARSQGCRSDCTTTSSSTPGTDAAAQRHQSYTESG